MESSSIFTATRCSQSRALSRFERCARKGRRRLHRDGDQTAISSNRRAPRGIEALFDAIFTCSEVGHGKDEPVIFRRAMEHFGAQRGSTVVFEDAIHAIETAKKDGFTVAAVFDESEKRQDEVRALADCYITSFEHLEQFWAMTAAD